MKDVSINSKVLLISMSRFLVQFMEVANKIPEEDYKKMVMIAQKLEKPKKGVKDNLERKPVYDGLLPSRDD
jgi:hypothetical protein